MVGFEREYYEQRELWKRDFLSIKAERERITSTIELIPSDVRTILDAGCGNGAFLNSLPDLYEAVGLDSSQEALKYVMTKAVHGDIADLPFEQSSFDLVTCLEVLEHLPSGVFENALYELQRVSKKYIIISVPNREDLNYNLVICPACRCWFHAYRHVRSFDFEKIRSLFEHYVLYELKEIGPLDPRPTINLFLYLAYRLWKSGPLPNTAVCPQCGYKPKDELSLPIVKSATLLSYALKLSRALARIIWPPKYCHR